MVARVVAIVALAAAAVAVVLVLTGSDDDGYEITAEFTNASQLVNATR